MGGEEYHSTGEERKDFRAHQASWQDAVTQYCSKQYDTPTGHAYPDGVAYFLHTLQSQAEQAGDRATTGSLADLHDTYGLISFPFLSFDAQRHYRPAFAKRGWLRLDDSEEIPAQELSDEQYGSLTQLLDKANIPELYKLSERGDIPHQTTERGTNAIPVAPLLADHRRSTAVFRHFVKLENRTEEEKEEEKMAAEANKLPTVSGMRLIKPVGTVIRVGFSPDSNREKR